MEEKKKKKETAFLIKNIFKKKYRHFSISTMVLKPLDWKMPQLWGDWYESNTSFLLGNHLQYCIIHLIFSGVILYVHAVGIGTLFCICRKGLSSLYKNSEFQFCNSLLKQSIFYQVVITGAFSPQCLHVAVLCWRSSKPCEQMWFSSPSSSVRQTDRQN